MAMVVEPGGSYFGLYSDFGDNMRGEAVSYGAAVASAAAADARPVADLAVPGDLDNPTVLDGHPRILTFSGDGSRIALLTTYDNGYWGDPVDQFVASNFLVEIQGPDATSFVVGEGGPFGIEHYVSSDGGQSIYLSSSTASLLTGVTRIKVWRAVVFPGDPIPEPPAAFWTSFVGAHEVLGESAGGDPGGGPGGPGGESPEEATIVPGVPYSATLPAIPSGIALWFKVALDAGTYTFHTTDSPNASDYDTFLALFSSDGSLIAENEDASPWAPDYRSTLTETLAAGDYYVALSSFNATAGSGFEFLGRELDLPAGTVFKIEAV